jgi:uncharacterized delta-60 repeat protein
MKTRFVQATAPALLGTPLGLFVAAVILVTGQDSTSLAQNGSLDMSFQAEVNAPIRCIAVQGDGKILIAGDFTSVNGFPRLYVARLQGNGDLDLGFDPGSVFSAVAAAVAPQPDGKIVVGGAFSGGITRLSTNGSADVSFNVGIGANGVVYAVSLLTNGQVLIAGNFTSVNHSNRSRVARLNSNGSVDAGFNTSVMDGGVHCISPQADGRVLIGGEFSFIGGTPRRSVARLRSDGSLDVSYYPDFGLSYGGGVYSIVQTTSAKIVVGGDFQRNVAQWTFLASLNEDGSTDTGFNPGRGPDSYVYALATQADGKCVVGGMFRTFNWVARTFIARLDPDGNLDPTFSPGLTGSSDSDVYCITLQPDGRILIAGTFSKVNGVTRIGIARLNADVTSPAANLSLARYAGLTIEGQVGGRYRLECTANLTNQTSWQTLADMVLSNGTFFYLDMDSPGVARRFYRAVTLP